MLVPFAQGVADVDDAAAIVAGDDGRHALHQVRFVALVIWIGKIAKRVRVWIDKAWSDNQSFCIDRSRGFEFRLLCIADKHNSIAANTDVSFARAFARAVNKFAVKDEEIEFLRRLFLRRGYELRNTECYRGGDDNREQMETKSHGRILCATCA